MINNIVWEGGNVFWNKKSEGIPVHLQAMSAGKGANLTRQIIPCHYLCSSIKFMHLMVANYYAYMLLYANDKTLLVMHFKTTIRIQI